VYITPLRFSDAQLRELAQGLQARKLPTFSVVGRSEVEAGVLMTTGGAERDTERLARRVAIMIQRISQGEDPATFEVGFPTSQRLLINMQVARAIGFSPYLYKLAAFVIAGASTPNLGYHIQVPRAYFDEAKRLIEEAQAAGPEAAAEAEAATEGEKP